MAAQPKLKDIKDYYAALEAYGKQGITHEGALRSAFQNLLAETGRRTGWTLIPELASGSIRPDGTFRDEYFLNRGYWEAKDTNNNLEAEIQKKIAKGYPLTNIIFEDTQRAYLYQNGQVAMQADLTQLFLFTCIAKRGGTSVKISPTSRSNSSKTITGIRASQSGTFSITCTGFFTIPATGRSLPTI